MSPRFGVVRGGADHLLSVRDVATRLGVCTATVYKLCDRGELAHVRVLSAIRIAPEDLARYLEQQHSLSDRVGRGKL